MRPTVEKNTGLATAERYFAARPTAALGQSNEED